MIDMFVEDLAWIFNGTELGNRLWKLHEKMRDRRIRKWRRKRK